MSQSTINMFLKLSFLQRIYCEYDKTYKKNSYINKEIYVQNFIFLAFWKVKLLSRFLYSSLSNKSFSIDNIVSPLNRSCDKADLKYDHFINFNFEKLISAKATITRIVNNIL